MINTEAQRRGGMWLIIGVNASFVRNSVSCLVATVCRDYEWPLINKPPCLRASALILARDLRILR
jgi:hypothetical protein